MKKHEVGVKQLNNEATQILPQVRQQGLQFTVTVDGEPVAVLMLK